MDRSNICNIVPSPYDERDWGYEARILSAAADVVVPTSYKCPNLLPVKSQGSRGTCVAMTVSCMREFQESYDNPELKGVAMSPNSLYIYRTTKTSGMYCRSALKSLQTHGMCTDAMFPYSRTKEPTSIPKLAVDEALNYRIKSYARVTTIEGAKKAILEFGPLLIAFPYYSNGSPQFWVKPSSVTKATGGHAVAVIGWTEKGFILRNSWGKSWNGDGHVVYPYDQWGAHWELWSTLDESHDYIPDHIKNKPDPVEPADPNKFLKLLTKICK